MKLLISSSGCTGHGRCYTQAPQLVDCDDEGFASPSDQPIEVPAEYEAVASKIVGTCPEAAISLT